MIRSRQDSQLAWWPDWGVQQQLMSLKRQKTEQQLVCGEQYDEQAVQPAVLPCSNSSSSAFRCSSQTGATCEVVLSLLCLLIAIEGSRRLQHCPVEQVGDLIQDPKAAPVHLQPSRLVFLSSSMHHAIVRAVQHMLLLLGTSPGQESAARQQDTSVATSGHREALGPELEVAAGRLKGAADLLMSPIQHRALQVPTHSSGAESPVSLLGLANSSTCRSQCRRHRSAVRSFPLALGSSQANIQDVLWRRIEVALRTALNLRGITTAATHQRRCNSSIIGSL